jgi:hypothetical protein
MRSFGYFLISVITFCVTAVGLRVLLPAPTIEGVSRKLQFVQEHATEIDTLFIGSSRVYHGVNPGVFDAITAAAGVPTHSYNFGVDSMLPPEVFFLVDEILATKPKKLRWIFIELDDVQVAIRAGDVHTQRSVSWHDWKRTWLVARKLLESDIHEKWKQKRTRLLRNHGMLAIHGTLFLQNLANSGRFFDLSHWYPQEEDASPFEYEPRGDGYAPTIVPLEGERRARYEAWLVDETASAKPREVDRYADQAFRLYAEKFRAIGAMPIFFVMPGSGTFLPSRFIGNQPAPVLAFNDPRAFPSLYLVSSRMDESHLNATGADEFTRLLALRFLSRKPETKG